MIKRFMNRHFSPSSGDDPGDGCRHTDCEYRDRCDRSGNNCLRHDRDGRGPGRGPCPENGRDPEGHSSRFPGNDPGPGGLPRRGHGGGRGFEGRGEHGHGRYPANPEDGSLRSLLLRAAQSVHHPRAGASQELVLRILDREGALDQHILRQELHIQPGSLSELLGKLEQKGLIGRERVESDRRRVTVRLTDEGREALTPGGTAADDPFAVLTDEEQSELRSLLEKLLSAGAAE